MKSVTVNAAIASAAIFQLTTAYPGMSNTFEEIRERQNDGAPSTELIGDLLTLRDNQLTATGMTIKRILNNTVDNAITTDAWTYPIPSKGSTACARDTCCIWQYIVNDMVTAYKTASGRCNDLARASVRLGFHDCAGWSKTTGNLGGCDGSLALSSDEINRAENSGLQTVVSQMKTWYNTYRSYGVGMADLIQMGATVATVTCPLGPRIRSYVGRKDSAVSAPNGLLPGVTQNANALIALFQAKTITPYGLTALIGAHTTSQQRFVDLTRAGDPQDSTPGVWDVNFYNQTLTKNLPLLRIFKFASDVALAADPRVATEFQQFAAPGGQDDWNSDYSREYLRVSLLGVFNINNLTDCSKVLPARISSYVSPDQAILNKWLTTTTHSDAIMNALLNGNLLSGLSGLLTGLFGNIFGFKAAKE
ncbi:peroxidase [Thozetella sp. PMI_491]|nr:peroxidase [Thozetella sp. PMI_491]